MKKALLDKACWLTLEAVVGSTGPLRIPAGHITQALLDEARRPCWLIVMGCVVVQSLLDSQQAMWPEFFAKAWLRQLSTPAGTPAHSPSLCVSGQTTSRFCQRGAGPAACASEMTTRHSPPLQFVTRCHHFPTVS